MFILAWAFTAQPFASKMGPKLRRRNLNQANNIEGPETTIKSPKTTNGHCHHCSINNPEKVAAKAVPNAPIAKLSDLTNVKEVSVNASTDWAYFDLTTGQTVSKDGNWQLGFNRYNIITNSGDSGTGSVGSFLAQKASGFYDDQGQLLEDKLTDRSLIAQAKTLLTYRSKWTTPPAATD